MLGLFTGTMALIYRSKPSFNPVKSSCNDLIYGQRKVSFGRSRFRGFEDPISCRFCGQPTSGLGRLSCAATPDHMGHLHITGSTSPSMGSVLSRDLVFHTLAPSNRDQNRTALNLQCHT